MINLKGNFDDDIHYLSNIIKQLRVDSEMRQEYFAQARRIRDQIYGPQVFFRGLIEISNFCARDCYYCGIRNSKKNVSRYRLTDEQILACCEIGYDIGYKTFVLQGGEDPYFSISDYIRIVSLIHSRWPDSAITLSLGEMEDCDYEKLFTAGATRYLLRHETADPRHYSKLHPEDQTLSNRLRCLESLKTIGYQTGAGMMIGTPYQTTQNLAADLLYLAKFQPHMVGIGPFMPASGTPFADKTAGDLIDTLIMLALARILVPAVLMPATTALGSLDTEGRRLGLLAGANVLMPNLSPPDHRHDYLLYDGKIQANDDAKANHKLMDQIVKDAGMTVSSSRGDSAIWTYH
jgi:biotin synthase